MPDPLELTTLKGHTLRLSYLGVGEPRVVARFELRFHDTRTHEEWAEEIRTEQAAYIVEWFGYPREVPPERKEVEAARAAERETQRLLAQSDARLAALQATHERMRSYAAILVNELQGAWWLKAAGAYEELRALLLEEQ